jgi:hypothetical protein
MQKMCLFSMSVELCTGRIKITILYQLSESQGCPISAASRAKP